MRARVLANDALTLTDYYFDPAHYQAVFKFYTDAQESGDIKAFSLNIFD